MNVLSRKPIHSTHCYEFLTHLELVSLDAQRSTCADDVQACASVLTDTLTFVQMGMQKFSDIRSVNKSPRSNNRINHPAASSGVLQDIPDSIRHPVLLSGFRIESGMTTHR